MNRILTVALLAVVLSSSCRTINTEKTDNYIYLQKQHLESKKWKLVWADDFNEGALNGTRWSKIGAGPNDWNKHMTAYAGCYAQTNGKLFLKGIKNPDTLKDSRPFLTGGVYTKGKFAFQYGKIEIRAKLEGAQGAWPAMWMLAEKGKYGAYPRNGEIDIMEHLNRDSIVYHTTHSYYTLDLKQSDNPPHSSTAKMNMSDYNTFGLEWYPDKLVFTVNGKETFAYPRKLDVDATQWPYDQPFYVIISQQLGGSWVGEVDSNQLPVQMIVDWVRVYQ